MSHVHTPYVLPHKRGRNKEGKRSMRKPFQFSDLLRIAQSLSIAFFSSKVTKISIAKTLGYGC